MESNTLIPTHVWRYWWNEMAYQLCREARERRVARPIHEIEFHQFCRISNRSGWKWLFSKFWHHCVTAKVFSDLEKAENPSCQTVFQGNLNEVYDRNLRMQFAISFLRKVKIPSFYYAGEENQTSFVMNLSNCRAETGRSGFLGLKSYTYWSLIPTHMQNCNIPTRAKRDHKWKQLIGHFVSSTTMNMFVTSRGIVVIPMWLYAIM